MRTARTVQFLDLTLLGWTLSQGFQNPLASPRSLDDLMAEFIALKEAGARLFFRSVANAGSHFCGGLLLERTTGYAAIRL